MEVNPVRVKTEPTHGGISYPLTVESSVGSHQLSVAYNVVPEEMKPQLDSVSANQCQGNGQRLDVNVGYLVQNSSMSNQVKSEYFSDTSQRRVGNSLDPLVSLTHATGKPNELLQSSTFQRAFSNVRDTGSEVADPNDSSQLKSASLVVPKPSEALFVRALIGRCKRIAPLWFRGVSSMRERNREENRRTASNNGQTQSDWSLIGLKIAEMNAGSETDAVANLLKKLYKELPTDSVFWFLKCWLGSEDSRNDPDSCVWRLDTIVGMLYHGLPMSSTDTNIMVHTCDQELCVRPQHIRFRASSVALVVVLKALAQAGYTVIPPPVAAGPNGVAPNASDESVDVFGPFTIEELQQYRSGESFGRSGPSYWSFSSLLTPYFNCLHMVIYAGLTSSYKSVLRLPWPLPFV
ncbi:unnamed protein product [Echinostoma caproni]|uniref:CTF/NF-I domain-containing protein n=1 Tax=Echinostoma caproni TaxID=27848 RepID=A0A183AFF5_9TREM|nr:unnamed protein product [Echinostoma caproni]